MKTNRAPWDYENKTMIVSQIVKLCGKCGSNMVHKYHYYCPKCGCLEYVEVFEHMAETFRRGLWEIETEKALQLVADMTGRFQYFRELVALSCLEAEQRYGLTEEQMIDEWLPPEDLQDEGADDRPSTQMREHD